MCVLCAVCIFVSPLLLCFFSSAVAGLLRCTRVAYGTISITTATRVCMFTHVRPMYAVCVCVCVRHSVFGHCTQAMPCLRTYYTYKKQPLLQSHSVPAQSILKSNVKHAAVPLHTLHAGQQRSQQPHSFIHHGWQSRSQCLLLSSVPSGTGVHTHIMYTWENRE